MKFHGVYTAIITPMDLKGYVDSKALEQLVRWQKDNGIPGVVVLGSTGEFLSLSLDEKKSVIEGALLYQSENFKIIVGIGTSDTNDGIKLAEMAQSLGADAVMGVVPFYNKPSQEGLYGHFASIAKAITIPLILYDNPTRTGTQLDIPTIIALHSNHKNIEGLKDSGPLNRSITLPLKLPQSLQIISGHDDFILPYLSLGVDAVISVTANIVPSIMQDIYKAWEKKQYEQARDTFFYLYPLIELLFVQPSPAPIKFMVHSIFPHISPMVRMPLMPLNEHWQNKIQVVLENYIDQDEQ